MNCAYHVYCPSLGTVPCTNCMRSFCATHSASHECGRPAGIAPVSLVSSGYGSGRDDDDDDSSGGGKSEKDGKEEKRSKRQREHSPTFCARHIWGAR